jgi:Tfp pilus assembly protein PilO
MMKPLKQFSDGFAALRLRDRVVVIAAVAAFLTLAGNLLLLKPRALEIRQLRERENAHLKELAGLKGALDQIESERQRGIDPLVAEKARLAEMRRQIRETETFMGGADTSASQVGQLVRGLIDMRADLQLVSLKTLPSAVFYTPPAPPKPQEGTPSEVDKVLAQLKQPVNKPAAAPVVLVNKTIYKHPVSISVKGAYPALLAYLQDMRKFPKRIFWADAKLDVSEKNYREATLQLTIYTLSDQAQPALN